MIRYHHSVYYICVEYHCRVLCRVLKMIITITITMLAAWIAESAVLDPALYLAPSPPLVLASDSIPPGEMWGRSLEERTERVARYMSENVEIEETTTKKPAAVESRMFWPRFNSPEPALGIHIPLTFSLSGSYGKVASVPAGVIGNTYATVAGLGTSAGSSLSSSLFGKSSVGSVYGSYGRSALAGSGYGTYGTSAVRVYGSDNVASWSGWGNGKWGHYGKG